MPPENVSSVRWSWFSAFLERAGWQAAEAIETRVCGSRFWRSPAPSPVASRTTGSDGARVAREDLELPPVWSRPARPSAPDRRPRSQPRIVAIASSPDRSAHVHRHSTMTSAGGRRGENDNYGGHVPGPDVQRPAERRASRAVRRRAAAVRAIAAVVSPTRSVRTSAGSLTTGVTRWACHPWRLPSSHHTARAAPNMPPTTPPGAVRPLIVFSGWAVGRRVRRCRGGVWCGPRGRSGLRHRRRARRPRWAGGAGSWRGCLRRRTALRAGTARRWG